VISTRESVEGSSRWITEVILHANCVSILAERIEAVTHHLATRHRPVMTPPKALDGTRTRSSWPAQHHQEQSSRQHSHIETYLA
jgi:hypothetical protein